MGKVTFGSMLWSSFGPKGRFYLSSKLFYFFLILINAICFWSKRRHLSLNASLGSIWQQKMPPVCNCVRILIAFLNGMFTATVKLNLALLLWYCHQTHSSTRKLCWTNLRLCGLGRRLLFKRSWVWIHVPDSGWTFFTLIIVKIVLFVFKSQINQKEARNGPYFKEIKCILISLQWVHCVKNGTAFRCIKYN